REAKTLASLNHPNVAGIHGVDQVDDVCFLALELVPGEDLAARLSRGALPVDEAIDVCRQIAEGLEAAHEAGVVHRDLKPANVRVTPDGTVKVLDFGLAKPLHPKATQDGTSTAESDSFLVTEEGLVLGTPTYMSPEQARGKPVDRRTDIWAFGCVLFECLTGRRAFSGETFSDVLAAIVGSEADLDALPRSTPRHVRELIARCLVKSPRERLRDAGEARLALGRTDVADEPSEGRTATGRARTWAGGLVTGGVLASLAMLAFRGEPTSDSAAPRHVSVPLSPTPGLYEGATNTTNFAISPDGQCVAFVTKEDEGNASMLAVRNLTEPAARTLPGTEGAEMMFFSPD
ncbi:MAG: protein kinase, partial [Gammaproteobacteria bacterium]|nr:protein kinase [Gammaproteobacteria bacterium]